MKNIDDVANAIVTLQVNAETPFEKGLVTKFQNNLLNFLASGDKKSTVKHKKVCLNCGKEFETGRSFQKFCSARCYSRWKGRLLTDAKPIGSKKVCLNCGKEFIKKHPHQKYCSAKCRKHIDYIKAVSTGKHISAALRHAAATTYRVADPAARN